MLRALLARLIDYSTYAGLFVLISGGVRTRRHELLPDLNLMLYGPLFLPLATCLVLGYRPLGSRVFEWRERLCAYIDSLPPPKLHRYLGISIAGCVACHGLVVYLRHFSFQTGMDLAIYANACRGALYSTMKGDVWIFADHFEPALLLFTPLCRAFTPAVTLLGVQTLAFGVGAIGIFALARQQNYSPSLAWFVALLYLGYSNHVTLAYYDFHLLALTLGLVPWLWWALQAKRYGIVIGLAVFYLGLKESVPLTLIGFGAYLMLRKGDMTEKKIGFGFVAVGLVSFAVIMKFVYPLFRQGEGTMYFAKYYGHLGRSLGEFVVTFVTRPSYFAAELLRPEKLDYMAMLVAPFLFYPLFRPVYLLPVLPAVLVNILSNDPNLLGRTYHYEAEISPALFAMAVIAFTASRYRPLWLAVLLVAFTAPSALGVARWNVPTKAQRRLLAQLSEHVPHDKAIAAPQRIAAHLTDRERLYMFDYWQMEEDWKRADIVVLGYHGDSMGWYTTKIFEEEKFPKMLPELRIIYQDPKDPRFRLYEVDTSRESQVAEVKPGPD
ncbi:MAG TPA: DUF2079 domain-containing protein [Polyangiales bacterium]|nr:DUF2079 domain-containing protein [Polyangiales bacterium]